MVYLLCFEFQNPLLTRSAFTHSEKRIKYRHFALTILFPGTHRQSMELIHSRQILLRRVRVMQGMLQKYIIEFRSVTYSERP